MDGYDRLRAATTALSAQQLRDCVESLVLGLYGTEDSEGQVTLTTDRDWTDQMVDGVIQVLAEYGLHPDDLNAPTSVRPFTAKRRARSAACHLRLVRSVDRLPADKA